MLPRLPKQLAVLTLLGLVAWPALAQQKKSGGVVRPSAAGQTEDRASVERAGTMVTREGLKLRLVTDIGHVVIITTAKDLAPGHLRYRVRIQADRRQPDADMLVQQFVVSARNTPEGVVITGKVPWRRFRGRVTANFEVSLPRRYHLDIQTQAGNIRTEDIAGNVVFSSAGGNLTAGRVGGTARLETQGGHINVRDVAGALQAVTAGGHVNIGAVGGDAVVKSLGGHISVSSVGGTANLETAGGSISLQRAGAGVIASTEGGRIDVGEAAGTVRARTAGGGIQVVKLAGPTQLETSGGSIYLTSVQSSVRATTAAGGITAWLVPDGRIQGGSMLESGSGDIIVYIPSSLAIRIECSVESDGDHRILADPGLPLKVTYSTPGPRPRVVRAEAALNGGSEVFRVRAQAGDIRLKFSDQVQQDRIRESQMKRFELWEKQFQEQQKQRLYQQQLEQLQQRMQQKVQEKALEQVERQLKEQQERLSQVEAWRLRVREKVVGNIVVDAGVQSRRLVRMVKPVYPPLAREGHVQGLVVLDVSIDNAGKVFEVKAVSGHPLLVPAAQDAVRQWEYRPTYLGQKPVAVATQVRIEFRLQ